MLIANFPSASVCVSIAWVLVMLSLFRETRDCCAISNVTLVWKIVFFFFFYVSIKNMVANIYVCYRTV